MKKTRFCAKGHNKDVVGRTTGRTCKMCKKFRTRDWRTKHPIKSKLIYQKSNEKRRKEGKFRDWHLQKLYKMTLTQFNELTKKQNCRCAICQVQSHRSLHVDHDHKTNKIRGLLCYKCNSLLGYAKDNVTILKSAIKFLMKGKK